MQINTVTTLETEGQIGVLTTNSPPVNAISAAVRQGLAVGMVKALADPAIHAIVIICEGRTFYAGADITEFDKPTIEPSLHSVQAIIEGSSKPVIVAIHGNALGGGLELALVGHFRIAETGAKLGLPEVNLGLLPGAGGTQRLPRLVGIDKSLQMITAGSPISAEEAKVVGLVDALAKPGSLRSEALAYARGLLAEAAPLSSVRDRVDQIADKQRGIAIIETFRSDNAELFADFHAPEAIVKCIEATLSDRTFEQGLEYETGLFGELLADPQSAAMRHIFFTERLAAKVDGLPAEFRPPRTLRFAMIDCIADQGLRQLLAAGGAIECDIVGADLVLASGLSDSIDLIAQLEHAAIKSGPHAVYALIGAASQLEPVAASFSRAENLLALRVSSRDGQAAMLEVIGHSATKPAALSIAMQLAKSAGAVGLVAKGASIIGQLEQAAARQCDVFRVEGISGHAIGNVMALLGLGAQESGFANDQVTTDLTTRVVSAMAAEGQRLVSSGSARLPSDIDVACVYGLGWKKYLGGPMFQSGLVS